VSENVKWVHTPPYKLANRGVPISSNLANLKFLIFKIVTEQDLTHCAKTTCEVFAHCKHSREVTYIARDDLNRYKNIPKNLCRSITFVEILECFETLTFDKLLDLYQLTHSY